jgi:hypothetical protein
VHQAQKALKAGAVQYLVFQRIFRRAVQRLQQQQLDINTVGYAGDQYDRDLPASLGIHCRRDRRKINGLGQQCQRVIQTPALGITFFAGEQADQVLRDMRLQIAMMPKSEVLRTCSKSVASAAIWRVAERRKRRVRTGT